VRYKIILCEFVGFVIEEIEKGNVSNVVKILLHLPILETALVFEHLPEHYIRSIQEAIDRPLFERILYLWQKIDDDNEFIYFNQKEYENILRALGDNWKMIETFNLLAGIKKEEER
jgi:hypothetical protein